MMIINDIAALILLLALIGALFWIMIAPTAVDRLMAIQLTGTTGVAVILILSRIMIVAGLLDVAMVFAILAAVTTFAFVSQTSPN
jgi:multicomponent Na+:H+ antiporter subunit F